MQFTWIAFYFPFFFHGLGRPTFPFCYGKYIHVNAPYIIQLIGYARATVSSTADIRICNFEHFWLPDSTRTVCLFKNAHINRKLVYVDGANGMTKRRKALGKGNRVDCNWQLSGRPSKPIPMPATLTARNNYNGMQKKINQPTTTVNTTLNYKRQKCIRCCTGVTYQWRVYACE